MLLGVFKLIIKRYKLHVLCVEQQWSSLYSEVALIKKMKQHVHLNPERRRSQAREATTHERKMSDGRPQQRHKRNITIHNMIYVGRF